MAGPTLLAAASYDPGTAASVSTASLLAMTAIDTTNLRVTFTAPASGTVLVTGRFTSTGSTAPPTLLAGILDGATVRLRMAPIGFTGGLPIVANNMLGRIFYGFVTGLTPGNSFTWDMAYGVEELVAATTIKYGGPNDNAGPDAWGAINFEVWDPGSNLLAATTYDPAVAASFATGLSAMAAFDTTNLRLTFAAPASGSVFWRVRTVMTASTVSPHPTTLLGIMESTTVVARQAARWAAQGLVGTDGSAVIEASGVITGVTAGSHSYDAARAIQLAGGSVNYRIKYGGPNNATVNDAFGGFLFELWDAAPTGAMTFLIQ